MKVALFAALILAAACAHGQRFTTAADLEPECKQAANGNLEAGASCVMVIDGFVHGYMAGAKRGVRVAFLDDRQNLETTRGADDAWRRISRLYPSAKCLPELCTT